MQSQTNWGFCDLSINRNYDLKNFNIIEEMGFNSIAINTHVEETSDEPKKKKKKCDPKEKKDCIPSVPDITNDITQECKLKILQRVTIEFSDSSISHKLSQSENIKQYDIIAVLPKTLQAFQHACGNLDVDIITFKPENRIPFKIGRKLYRQAAERGIFFEVMYSPAIRDSTCRKNIISSAHTYHAIGKSRNLIISSGAENSTQIRSVQDVINLGFILGLSSQQSIQIIKNNARKLILKARGRKCGKHYIEICSGDDNDNKGNEEYY